MSDIQQDLLSKYTPEQVNKLMSLLPLIADRSHEEIAVIINRRAGRIIDTSKISIKSIINQIDITMSELEEAREAALALEVGPSDSPKNVQALADLVDAIADIQVCNLGQASRLPININREYLNVVLTNLTRIPQTIEEAQATVEYWGNKGIECYIGQGINPDGTKTYPVLTADRFQTSIDNERFSPNKFVKGINTVLPKAYALDEVVNFVE